MTERITQRPEVDEALKDGSSRQFLIRQSEGELYIFVDVYGDLTHQDIGWKYLNEGKDKLRGGYIQINEGNPTFTNPSTTVPEATPEQMLKAWEVGVVLL